MSYPERKITLRTKLPVNCEIEDSPAMIDDSTDCVVLEYIPPEQF